MISLVLSTGSGSRGVLRILRVLRAFRSLRRYKIDYNEKSNNSRELSGGVILSFPCSIELKK